MTDSDETVDTEGTGTFTSIPESECRELLSVGTVGHLAFHGTAGIQLFPLNFLYQDGFIYFRVDAGSELGGLAEGSADVAFGVDHLDELVKQAWSVVAKGRIGAVTDSAELDSLHGHRKLQPWAVGDRRLYLRLEPVTVTGRKVKRNAR